MILLSRTFFCFSLVLFLACPWLAYADPIDLNPANPKPMVSDQPAEEELSNQNSFVKPYDYERQAMGYDPDGVIYHENKVEDFQVIFLTALPFTALASFGLNGLVSTVATGQFSVGGDFFWPFIGGMLLGATTVACVSVLSNPYPPPATESVVQLPGAQRPVAFLLPLMTARF